MVIIYILAAFFITEAIIIVITRVRRKKKPPKPVTNLQVKAKIIKRRRHVVTTGVLTWTFPSQRTDGTAINPSDNLTATIFDSLQPGPGIGSVNGTAGQPGTFTTGALAGGTHNFTVTITDSEGNTSAVSNVATLVVPSQLASPNAVTDLSVTAGP